MVRLVASAVAVGVVAALVGACGSHGRASTPSDHFEVHRFNAEGALELARRQVAFGQRPAGSPQLHRLADQLRPRLPHGHFEPVRGAPGLRNIVGTLRGRLPAILIGAHYDTLVKPRGFVGANNGAAGTAVVIEAARALWRVRRPRGAREIRFVLFDGEEPPAGLPEESTDFYSAGLRGSRAYVAEHRREIGTMVLLDYVGNKGLQLPKESTSTRALWLEVRAAAQAVGAGRFFPPRSEEGIIDDHTPFLRAGIPAVDLIDWSYEGHTTADTIARLSAVSLDAVGETVVELLRRLDRL